MASDDGSMGRGEREEEDPTIADTKEENGPSGDKQPEESEPDISKLVADVKAFADALTPDLLKFTSEYKSNIRKSNPDSDPNKNFTWEHFFTTKCGILRKDARKYEEALIAHRLDPLDTLRESLGIVIEYARIPIGDKLKISKTIQGKEQELESKGKGMEEAKKSIGLEKFNDMQARMIMGFAGGDSEYHIECGIEQFEDGMEELNRMMHIQMIKDPKCAEGYESGASLARLTNNPTLQFLQSFGYETFEYTKNKTVAGAAVPNRPTSSDPVAGTLLLGNMTEHLDLNDRPPNHMYS